ICGSDLHEYYAGPVFTRAHEPHPFSGVMNPVIIGHELCGEVVEVGPGVEGVATGDLVAVEPVETCGTCPECRAGRRCRRYAIHGYTRSSGGFSEYSLVKESMAHKLPAGIGPLEGSLIEPLSVGMIAANRTGAMPGETVVVHGLGPIGIAVLLALRARGVRLIAADPSQRRREAVDSLGIDAVLDPVDVDVVAAVRDLTDGAGAASSVDAAGVPAALAASIASTAANRRVVLTAVPLQPIAIDVAGFHASQVFLTPSTGTTPVTTAFDEVIDLMLQGHYPTAGWTETIAFDDLIDGGFRPLHRQEKVKVIVDMATAATAAA
ncbi:MAG: alcohol dehydrogenase catalytic domain-containing protein, partial [Chloroflexota bacterium]|nr:alcohol dehydrogenase catalytic domain-containing protein [Chloroflexota bacterium]